MVSSSTDSGEIGLPTGHLGARRLAAGTIVASNYLAHARVLCQSFQRFHPDVEFVTLIIDAVPADRQLSGMGTVLTCDDLELDAEVLHCMMVIYDVMELATALKPALLMALLRRGAKAVAYIDPDVMFHAAIDDIFALAEREAVVLTPHICHPMPRDGHALSEPDIMAAGIYNLGFIAVGPGGWQFLHWWHERLRTDALVDPANQLFTDQRWVDWLPALFPHHVCRDPGLNVAYWNAHERPLAKAPDGTLTAAGAPLRFYHFSGFDPDRQWALSKHFGLAPRVLLSESLLLQELCNSYTAALMGAGYQDCAARSYRHAVLPSGQVLTPALRRYLREVHLGHIDVPAWPDPWGQAPEFQAWLDEPRFHSPDAWLSLADHSLWRSRPDLQANHPDVLGAHMRPFAQFLDDQASDTPGPVVRPRRVCGQQVAEGSLGWSVIGYLRSELGVGEAGRRLGAAMGRVGVACQPVDMSTWSSSRNQHPQPRSWEVADQRHPNALICVNADQLARATALLGLDQRPGRRVGLWFWELSEFPAVLRHAFDLVDEVWVASPFVHDALRPWTDKPIRVVKLPASPLTQPTGYQRADLGLPEGRTVFLVNFDALSVMARKNPIGAVAAYCQAFEPGDGATLYVHSINGQRNPLELERIRLAAGGRPDIIISDGYLTAARMRALIELSDCYVSLHRSEGYGLNIADALNLATPVIATGYSGNLAFMDERDGALIPYELVNVGPDAGPYDPRATWAEPSVPAAADAMRAILNAPAQAASRASRAQLRYQQEHAMPAAVEVLRELVLPGVLANRAKVEELLCRS